eukprot:GHVT01093209.1.p1 GENE.GHVT01093209.1~~GHVT01093209.1.p1  ORF type:complete len:286 (+),score=64.99 GHVT01093209.1:2426-3283(+)
MTSRLKPYPSPLLSPLHFPVLTAIFTSLTSPSSASGVARNKVATTIKHFGALGIQQGRSIAHTSSWFFKRTLDEAGRSLAGTRHVIPSASLFLFHALANLSTLNEKRKNGAHKMPIITFSYFSPSYSSSYPSSSYPYLSSSCFAHFPSSSYPPSSSSSSSSSSYSSSFSSLPFSLLLSLFLPLVFLFFISLFFFFFFYSSSASLYFSSSPSASSFPPSPASSPSSSFSLFSSYSTITNPPCMQAVIFYFSLFLRHFFCHFSLAINYYQRKFIYLTIFLISHPFPF